MPILTVYVDDRTMDILREYAERSGRRVEELAECAVAESAIRSIPPHLRAPAMGLPLGSTPRAQVGLPAVDRHGGTPMVVTIDSTETELRVTVHESLEAATSTPAAEGWMRAVVRDTDELLEIGDGLLLRVYNFEKGGKPIPAIKNEKHKKKIAAAAWAIVSREQQQKEALTSAAADGKDGPSSEGEGSSGNQEEKDMATKKRPSTKKAKAAKAKRKAAGGQPRGEKTLKVKSMLERKSGCTRAEVLEATGWKAVSMQQMAKACGLKLRLEKQDDKPGKPIRYFAA